MYPVYTQPALGDVSLKMVERTIPVVDFAVMGLNREKPPTLNEESVRVLADQIHKAFSTIGFVYLTNHGISEKEVGNHKMVCICLVKIIVTRRLKAFP